VILSVTLRPNTTFNDDKTTWDIIIEEYKVWSVIDNENNENLMQLVLNEIRDLILFKQEFDIAMKQLGKELGKE